MKSLPRSHGPVKPPESEQSAAPVEDDGRDALALSADENADLCSGCVKCCTYITVEVDAPRSPWEYDQWIWALHHRNISLFVEKPERWFLSVDAVCEQLNDQGRCSIYGRHPVLCREYDPRSCERRLPLSDIAAWFSNAAELEAWLEAKRPAHWARLMKYRNDQPQGPPKARGRRAAVPGPALIGITGLGGVAASGGVAGRNGEPVHGASGAARGRAREERIVRRASRPRGR